MRGCNGADKGYHQARRRRTGWRVTTWLASGGLVVAGLAGGCNSGGSDSGATTQPDPFVSMLSRHCSGCHGKDGHFGPAPPLNDPAFAVLVPDEVLWETLRRGRTGNLMPAWSKPAGGPLSDEQIGVLIAGIRSYGRPEAAAGLPPYLAPQGQVGNARRGGEAFDTDCAGCHRQDGAGGSGAGPLNQAAFLQLIGPQEVRRIAITGRPDLGMPDVRARAEQFGHEPLDSQQIQDVVAWLGSLLLEPVASRPQGASQEDRDVGRNATGPRP